MRALAALALGAVMLLSFATPARAQFESIRCEPAGGPASTVVIDLSQSTVQITYDDGRPAESLPAIIEAQFIRWRVRAYDSKTRKYGEDISNRLERDSGTLQMNRGSGWHEADSCKRLGITIKAK